VSALEVTITVSGVFVIVALLILVNRRR